MRSVEHPTARGGTSEGSHRAATAALTGLVHSYDGYRLAGFEAGVHLGLPSPYLTVVLTLDAPLTVAGPTSVGSFDTLASGISKSAVSLPHDGNQHGIQISLTPLGARMLLGMPTAELGENVIELGDVIGSDAAELHERIAAEATWDRRFAVCDEVFTRRAADLRSDLGGQHPAVGYGWHRLTSDGAARVAEVAEDIGWSRRHLITRFRAEFGLSPKDAVRIGRFHRAHQLLRRDRIPPLSDIAGACGYYDQAHMAREWRELAGLAPSAWRRSENFAFVQDTWPGSAQS